MTKKLFFFIAISLIFSGLYFYQAHQTNHETIYTIYGNFEIHEPILRELLHSKAFERLKGIRQYGVDDYIHTTQYPYTRYTHSLGVFALLRKYGAPLEEQIAGLLHDVSHTVFSHVGDHVAAKIKEQYLNQNNDAYQDTVHCWHLKQTDIPQILAKYGLSIENINHKGGTFPMLEAGLPDICADRLEYNLYGGYIEGWITKQEIKDLLTHLHYDHNRWWLDDVHQAQKLARLSLRLCEEIFASSWNIGSYEWAAKALLRAVELDLISMHTIHFGQDDPVWKILTACDDPIIKEAVSYILNAYTAYHKSDETSYDLKYVSKFRGINPWVQTPHGYYRLTELEKTFAQEYDRIQASVSQIHYLQFAAATA